MSTPLCHHSRPFIRAFPFNLGSIYAGFKSVSEPFGQESKLQLTVTYECEQIAHLQSNVHYSYET